MPAGTSVVGVDDHGLRLVVRRDEPLDVLVDGRRVWTFWTVRDTDPVRPWSRGVPALLRLWSRPLARHAAWPSPLLRRLDGTARIAVSPSTGGAPLFDATVRFGSGEGALDLSSPDGVPLGIDKSGKLVATFEGRSRADLDALLDAVERIVVAVRSAGLDPFLAYGTLLGAVREGRFLAHDSDADLGYVSGHAVPVDVVRESFALQRHLVEDGWAVDRYSGGALKVSVAEGAVRRGVDVFGGFFSGGRLTLLGEVREPFDPAGAAPTRSALLEGRPLPVPEAAEDLLALMYGPGWRTPDPAFRFTTPPRTVKALNAWFRGNKPGARTWERRASATAGRPLRRDPHAIGAEAAVRAAELRERYGSVEVLDVGAGRGRDALWLAGQGFATTAYDYVLGPLREVDATARAEGLPLEVRGLNLTELRSALSEGCRLAHRRAPRVVVASHVLEATSSAGRDGFRRFCSMALRSGGTVLVRSFVDDGSREGLPAWVVDLPDRAHLVELLGAAGAREVVVQDGVHEGHAVCDLVATW